MGDVLILVGLFLSSLLLAGAPLAFGVTVVVLVPGLGGLRPGVTPTAVVGGTMSAIVLGLVFGESLERISRRPFGRYCWAGTLAAEATSLGFVWLLILPLMSDGWSALLATSIGAVPYKSLEPLLDRWDRKERAEGDGQSRQEMAQGEDLPSL